MSEFLEITGGAALKGSVRVSGAKNAVLPMLIASLLTSEECRFTNVPNLEDVSLMMQLLEHFGGVTTYKKGDARVRVAKLEATEASYSLVRAMRASFWVLAPLLARGRAARVALPGGDIIGARPVDLHLAALERMGADIKVKHGVVYATAVKGLKPATIDLRFPSVGATHQIMMAAALTPGTTVINGAAREPEVVALADMIRSMGGDIEGAGSPMIAVRGKEELGGVDVRIIGDRIEAGTYLLAAAATGGSVTVEGINPEHLGDFLGNLSEMGMETAIGPDWISIKPLGRIKAVNLKTGPFPQFATDLQAPVMAALVLADGESTIEENIYEGRFGHVSELCRMGAQIRVDGRSACIAGVERLSAAPVEGFDIRAAAALVIAGLAAEGVTQIFELQHIHRGYERLVQKLQQLGAKVRVKVADAEDYMFSGC